MSYFYPHSGYSRFPFFDAIDQSPYHHSSSPYHRYSPYDPMGLTHLRGDLDDVPHRSPSIYCDRLARDPPQNHLPRHNPLYGGHTGPTSYEDSIRAERARRLAEAKLRQQAQSKSDEQTKVEVTLPDGRQCVVPLSWAKKMQSKYPNILTNSMIHPHTPPSPPPIRLDQQSASDSDHDSDFYVLDPTQDPSVPSVTGPTSVPVRHSPSSQPPKYSPEELDSAARLIQQQFRTYGSLKRLSQIESTFRQLKSGFTYPSPLDLTFLDPPQQSSGSTPSRLAFNNSVNRPVQAFEEGLTQLQIKADAVLSRGNIKIKNWRKRLIKEIESQLGQLDRFKNEAWNLQKLTRDTGSSAFPDSQTENPSDPAFQSEKDIPNSTANRCEDVEMNCDILHTDNKGAASGHFSLSGNGDSVELTTPTHQPHAGFSDNGDSGALITPISTSAVGQPTAQSEENLVIPMTAPLGTSLENLVIPASSARNSKLDGTSPCVVTPLVTQEGDLVCPAPTPSRISDDILVSPI